MVQGVEMIFRYDLTFLGKYLFLFKQQLHIIVH